MRRSTRRGTLPGNGLSLLRLRRGALLATTALQAGVALAFALPAAAQPAPSARPQGGSVVAGQASISQGGNTTTITQSSNRAAIDWRSFDVGADQRVVFQQPGASSVTLNRVTTPTPSQIAGRIEANGQVVVINGAGVVFHQGAQVEAQSFVASTADTTNAAFMAGGRLTFDRPGQPGARIENRGNITVRDTGLAALVAPGVANSGTISARMGTVVLAGAETHTIDLHGDGLVSFDVTSQVRSAPLGPDGRPTAALVTNNGTVLAEGGRVLITAQAADGVVQNLVNAGGTIRADSVGSRTGSVEIAGIGGSIRVQGTVAAEGTRAGERGGTVVANTTGELTLGDTARVVASGRAGGGTVAVGTTAARARAQTGGVGAGTARRTTVAQGARVEADATERGDGGRIAMLGQENIAFAGTSTARGGPQGGNGGQVEVSSAGGLSLTGSVDTSAPLGTRGTLLIDPRDLRIVDDDNGEIATKGTSPQVGATDGGAGTDATLSISTISLLLNTSNVRLEATRNLSVDNKADFSSKSGALTLAAGNNVVINAELKTKGDLALIAGDTTITGALSTGQVQVKANIESTDGAVLLMASGSGGAIAFDTGAKAAAATRLTLVANSVTLPTATNSLQAPTFELSSKSGAMSLGTGADSGLAITDLSGLKTSGLTQLRFGGATLGGTVTNLASGVDLAGNLTLSNVALDLRATGAVTRSGGTLAGVSTLTGNTGGNFLLDGANHAVTTVGAITAGASGTGRIALKLSGDRAFTQEIANKLTAPGGFHFEADGKVTVTASVTALNDMALTGTSVTTDDGATLTGVTLKSTNGAVALTGTGADGISLKGPVIAKTRIGLQADKIETNGNTLTTTDGTGVVERARQTAGDQVVSAGDFTALKVSTGTLRLGAITRPGDSTPTATATTIDVAGSPTGATGYTTLDLQASGAITQSVKLDTTGFTLAARAASVTLDRSDNVIPTLGAVTGLTGGANTGDVSIRSGAAMEAAGAVNAGGAATLRANGTLTVKAATGSVAGDAITLKTDTGNIALNGAVTATNALTLNSAADVTGSGVVTAGTLLGTMNALQLSGANLVTKIGNVSAQGGFELKNTAALEVSGTLKAALGSNADIVLKATSLNVTGTVETGSAAPAGGIIEMSASGNISVAGTVRARSATGTVGNVLLSSTTGSVTQTAGLIEAADQVTLNGATGVSQTGGVIDTPRFLASATGTGAAIGLAGSNRIDTLAGLTAARGITVNNAIALKIEGPVRAGQEPTTAPGAPVSAAITSAGAMTVQGTVAAGQAGPPAVSGNVALTSTDGFLRNGSASKGAIDVLAGTSFAPTRIAGAGGEVTLKASSADAAAGIITVATPVAAPSGGTLSLTATTVAIGGAGGAGTLSAPSGKVVIAANAMTLDGAAPTLIDATGGTVTLAPRDAGRTISLGGGSGQLVLKNDGLSRIAADVLEIGRLDGGDITIAGATDVTTASTLRLLTGGNIGASAGAVLKVGMLEGQAGGAIALDSPGGPHAVTRLGDLKAAGTLAFRAAGALDVEGDVTGSSVALTGGALQTLRVIAGGSVAAGNDGVVTLAADLISLAGAVETPGSAGRIEILPVTAGRAITLAGAGGLSLLQADLDQLSAATLLLGARDGSAAVAGNLTVAGIADLTGGVDRLRVRISGDLADTGVGSGLRVGALGDASGSGFVHANSVSLGSTGNRIGTLERLRVTDALLLASETALTVAGPVEAGADVTLRGLAAGANALQVTGGVASGTLGGAASGSGGTLTLNTTQGGLTVASGGTVLARGGAIDIQGATSGSGGATSIANGATVTAGTTATVSGAAGLSVAGSVQAGTGVQLTASPPPAGTSLTIASTGSVTATTGDVGLNVTGTGQLLGAVTATAGNLVLNGGTITGTGAVDANAVTGTAAALTLNGSGNRIDALQSLTTTSGGIAVNSLNDLSILGTVQSAGAVTLGAPTITIGAFAQLQAAGQTVTLDTDTGISAPGRIVAGTLQGSGGTGGASFSNTANDITTLGNLDGAGVVVNSASALTVSGTVDGTAGVTITTTATAPTATTPRLTVTGSVLSDGSVTLVTDNGQLALAGTVTGGGHVRVASSFGEVRQTTGSVTGASLAADARTAVIQTGGTMTSKTGDLAVDATSFDLRGTVNAGRDLLLSNLNLLGPSGSLTGTIDAGRDITGSVLGGPLTLGGSVTAARSVALSAATSVTQSGTLTATSGSVQLTAEGGNLSINGAVKAGGATTLRAGLGAPVPGTAVAGRDISVGGSAEAGTTLTLTALGAVNAASGVLKAATLTGSSGGNATMTGANLIGTLGAFAAGNTLSLDNAQALTAAGPVTALGTIALDVKGALTLAAPSAGSFTLDAPTLILSATSISQTGGAVRATTLLDAEATGAIKLDRSTNVLPVLAADAGGDVTVVTAGGLNLANPVTGTNVTLTAQGGDIVQSAGTLSWTDTATLTASGAIRQDGGTLDGSPNGLLTGSAGTSIALTQPGNVIPRLGPLTAGSGISVATGGDLSVVGALGAGTGALVLDAGGGMTLGPVALTGASVTLEAGGALTQQAGGSLTTAGALLLTAGTTTLNGTISAGSADLNTAGLSVTAGGSLTVTGLLDIAATGDTALDGSVGAGSATISTAGLSQAAGGALTVTNGLTVTASGDTALDGSVSAASAGITTAGLSQAAGGSLTITNGLTINASADTALDGSVAAASAGITTAGLSQAAGGTLTITNGLTINASGDTALDGSVAAASANITTAGLSQAAGGSLGVAGPLAVTATGDTALNGGVTAGTATITTAGFGQAAGGTLTVTNGLTLGASGDAALHGGVSAATATITAGGAIAQNAGGSLATTGLLDLKAGTDIRLDGTVSGTPLRLTAGGDIGQAATGTLTTTTLTLSAGGDVALLGKLSAGLVTGAAGGSLVLDGPATLVDRVENLSAGTFLVVEADGPLVAAGTLSAPTMIVRSAGALQLSTLKVLTGGVPFVQPPRGGLSLSRLPDPTTSVPGATFETRAATLKIDTLTIDPLSGTNATAALRLPTTGGTMTLGQVQGPKTDLTLDLGTGGQAAGDIQLRNLIVLGGAGGTNLTGTIGGLTGEAAASQAGLGPRLQPEYQINNCPLASVNCVQIVVQLPAPTDPLRDLGLISTRDDRDDPDIFVPNVAERDF